MTERTRILIVDDEDHVRQMLDRGLSRAGFRCVTSETAYQAAMVLLREKIDLVLLDVTMPGMSGLEFLKQVAAQYPDVAVVMLSGLANTTYGVQAMREGADDYVTKPVSFTVLISRINGVLSRRALALRSKAHGGQGESLDDLFSHPTHLPRILIVDDEENMLEVLEMGLTQSNYRCVTAASARDAYEILNRQKIDLVLLDIRMPDESGMQLLPRIKTNHPDVAVVMLSGKDDMPTAVLAMRQGADDYVTKPVAREELIIRIELVLGRRTLLLEEGSGSSRNR